MYGALPPDAFTVATPLLPPLHDTFCFVILQDTFSVCADTVPLHTLVQPFTSVTVTVYEPEHNPVAVLPVCPLLHKYVNGAEPPDVVAVAVPLQLPQSAGVVDETLHDNVLVEPTVD